MLDVAIFIEHISRELESAVYLKVMLEKQGLKCKIYSTHFNIELAKLIRAKIKIIPWAYDTKDVKAFLGKNIFNNKKTFLLNLHHEQIGCDSDIEFMLPTGVAKEVYHLSWGKKYSNRLKKENINQEKILEFGSPRIDFYHKKMKRFSKDKKSLANEFKLNQEKRWILFAGNFSLKDFSEETIVDLENRGIKGIKEFTELSKINYRIFLEWVEKFLKNSPDIEFIYRPHPSEKVDTSMKKIFEKYSNFRVIREYAVRDWIVNSDIVNVWTSTSGIEAIIADKKLNIIRFTSIPSYLEIETYKGYDFITNYESFERENLNIQKKDQKIIMSEIQEFYTISSKKTCVENLANEIERLLKNKKVEVEIYDNISNENPISIILKVILEKSLSKIYKKVNLKEGYKSKNKIYNFCITKINNYKRFDYDYFNDDLIKEIEEKIKRCYQK